MIEVHLARSVVWMPADYSIESHDWVGLQDERGIVTLGDLSWIVKTVTMVERHLDLLIDVFCLQIPIVILLERLNLLHRLLNLSILLLDLIRIELALLSSRISLVMLGIFSRCLHLAAAFVAHLLGLANFIAILFVKPDRFLGLGVRERGQSSFQFGSTLRRRRPSLLRSCTGFLCRRSRAASLTSTLLWLLFRFLVKLHLLHGLIKLLLRFFLRKLHPIVLREPGLILGHLKLHVLVQTVHLIRYVRCVDASHING